VNNVPPPRESLSHASGAPTALVHTTTTEPTHSGVPPAMPRRGRSGLIAAFALAGVAAAVGVFMVLGGNGNKDVASQPTTAALAAAPPERAASPGSAQSA